MDYIWIISPESKERIIYKYSSYSRVIGLEVKMECLSVADRVFIHGVCLISRSFLRILDVLTHSPSAGILREQNGAQYQRKGDHLTRLSVGTFTWTTIIPY